MSRVDLYLDAAERANTGRGYASAIRHFEVEWGGLLPATIDSIARHLSDHAESLSLNTLKHRLAALSRWHQDHGFADPTKAAKIRQLLKGIRALHPAQEKRAKPLTGQFYGMGEDTDSRSDGSITRAIVAAVTGKPMNQSQFVDEVCKLTGAGKVKVRGLVILAAEEGHITASPRGENGARIYQAG